MTLPFRPAIIALALTLVMPAVGWTARLPGPLTARVVEVVDGDTLSVRVMVWLDQEVTTKVRLEGIDTPESRSDCAEEKRMAAAARDKLAALVVTATTGQGDGSIRLHDVVHDKFGGRVRARVTLADGTDVAEAMIRSGHARAYQGGKRTPWCGGM